MIAAASMLLAALREPVTMTALDPAQWDLLLRQARSAGLLGRLGVLAAGLRDYQHIPQQVRHHLESARAVAARQASAVRWEVDRIMNALQGIQVQVVLLKGAAYVLRDLPAARGRSFADVDVMVPRAELAAVETALARAGWWNLHHDAYDQRYYRDWMHELPPLRHIRRSSVLDLHHTILPPTAGLKLDPPLLFAAAQPLEDVPGAAVLAPCDMVLHSAAHLFFDGELDHGLRDICDLADLFETFGQDDAFWPALPARAKALDLTLPLAYALRYLPYVAPPAVADAARTVTAALGLTPVRGWVMDALFERALAPVHESCSDPYTGIARWAVYVRAHRLRMPLHLLVPHLVRKAVKRGNSDRA
jgi:hypothetical protein